MTRPTIQRRLLPLAAAALLAFALCAQAASPAAARAQDHGALVESLQQGGLVLVIRHERTEVPSRDDDYSLAPDDCRAQRNLSVAGVAGAQETRTVLRALGVRVDRVISSPMCRTAETARRMFDVGYETDRRLMHENPAGGRDLDAAAQDMRTVLAELEPVAERTNIALVGHGGAILQVTGLDLSEGEIGVVRLAEDDSVAIVGRAMGSDLAPFARKALRDAETSNPPSTR